MSSRFTMLTGLRAIALKRKTMLFVIHMFTVRCVRLKLHFLFLPVICTMYLCMYFKRGLADIETITLTYI